MENMACTTQREYLGGWKGSPIFHPWCPYNKAIADTSRIVMVAIQVAYLGLYDMDLKSLRMKIRNNVNLVTNPCIRN